MVPVTHDLAGSTAAQLLADSAHALARSGATSDTVLTGHRDNVPAELAKILRGVVEPPDRSTGWRLVRGLLDELAHAGPTPADWRVAPSAATDPLDIAIVLVAAGLGSVFGWTGQQDGRLLHNIIPTRVAADLQVGASSSTPLHWHTEDAFHPERADLLVLACVRNEDSLGSRVAAVRRAALAPQHVEQLKTAGVAILPDDSYPNTTQRRSRETLRPVVTLWDDDGVCVRYDPSYSRILNEDHEFRAAYDALGQAFDDCAETVPLAAGDLVVIDNDVAVHGRATFRPRFDGTDRWLKRALVRARRHRPFQERLETGYAQELAATVEWVPSA
jgi:L-asparagine oxygenase